MKACARVWWMWIAVVALTPASVFAQGTAAQAPAQPVAAQGKAEETPKADPAQTKTEEGQASTEDGAKLKSVPGGKALGMSILGNQEAPTSLVIVPWKTSELGNAMGISTMLDDSRKPIDKEVFMRALSYYELIPKTTSGTPAGSAAAPPATAVDRRKQ